MTSGVRTLEGRKVRDGCDESAPEDHWSGICCQRLHLAVQAGLFVQGTDLPLFRTSSWRCCRPLTSQRLTPAAPAQAPPAASHTPYPPYPPYQQQPPPQQQQAPPSNYPPYPPQQQQPRPQEHFDPRRGPPPSLAQPQAHAPPPQVGGVPIEVQRALEGLPEDQKVSERGINTPRRPARQSFASQ